MAVLSFTLNEEAVAVFHDALACIVKFSEDVTLEAKKDKVGPIDIAALICSRAVLEADPFGVSS